MSSPEHSSPSEETEPQQDGSSSLQNITETDTDANTDTDGGDNTVQRKKKRHRSGVKVVRGMVNARLRHEERLRESDELPANKDWEPSDNGWENILVPSIDGTDESAAESSSEQHDGEQAPAEDTENEDSSLGPDTATEGEPEPRKRGTRAGRKRNKNRRIALLAAADAEERALLTDQADDPSTASDPATSEPATPDRVISGPILPNPATPDVSVEVKPVETEPLAAPAPSTPVVVPRTVQTKVSPSQSRGPSAVRAIRPKGHRKGFSGLGFVLLDTVLESPVPSSTTPLRSAFSASSDESDGGDVVAPTSATLGALVPALYISPSKIDWSEEEGDDDGAAYWEEQKRRVSTGSFISEPTPSHPPARMEQHQDPESGNRSGESAASAESPDQANQRPVVPPRPAPLTPGLLASSEATPISPTPSDSSSIESTTGWKIKDGVRFVRNYPAEFTLTAARQDFIRTQTRAKRALQYAFPLNENERSDLHLRKMFELEIKVRTLLKNYNRQQHHYEEILGELRADITGKHTHLQAMAGKYYQLKSDIEDEQKHNEEITKYAGELRTTLQQAQAEKALEDERVSRRTYDTAATQTGEQLVSPDAFTDRRDLSARAETLELPVELMASLQALVVDWIKQHATNKHSQSSAEEIFIASTRRGFNYRRLVNALAADNYAFRPDHLAAQIELVLREADVRSVEVLFMARQYSHYDTATIGHVLEDVVEMEVQNRSNDRYQDHLDGFTSTIKGWEMMNDDLESQLRAQQDVAAQALRRAEEGERLAGSLRTKLHQCRSHGKALESAKRELEETVRELTDELLRGEKDDESCAVCPEHVARIRNLTMKVDGLVGENSALHRRLESCIETVIPAGERAVREQPQSIPSRSPPRPTPGTHSGEIPALPGSWREYEARLRSSSAFKDTLQNLRGQRWRERKSNDELEALRQLAYNRQFGIKCIPFTDLEERRDRWNDMAGVETTAVVAVC